MALLCLSGYMILADRKSRLDSDTANDANKRYQHNKGNGQSFYLNHRAKSIIRSQGCQFEQPLGLNIGRTPPLNPVRGGELPLHWAFY